MYDVLPEFIEYWLNADCAFRPAQWQAKYQAAVRHQWNGEMSKQRNQAKVLNACDLKANAIAALKAAQTQKLVAEAGRIGGQGRDHWDRSWAIGLDMDDQEGWD